MSKYTFWETYSGFGGKSFYFRIFGYGLHFQLINSEFRPYFSERYGYKKPLYIGKLRIEYLRKDY
jgi:hypothetical protein